MNIFLLNMKEETATANTVYYDKEGMWIFDSMLDMHYKLNLMDDHSRDTYEKNMNLGSYAVKDNYPKDNYLKNNSAKDNTSKLTKILEKEHESKRKNKRKN